MKHSFNPEDLTTFKVTRLAPEPGYVAFGNDYLAPMALGVGMNLAPVKRAAGQHGSESAVKAYHKRERAKRDQYDAVFNG